MEKQFDLGMLTFEDRHPNFPSYKHTDASLEDELAWAQIDETYPGNEPGCKTKGVCGGCDVCGEYDANEN